MTPAAARTGGAAAVTGVAAAAAATALNAALRRRPPGGAARWARVNHRGEDVTLLEGPGFVAGAVATLLLPVAPRPLRAGAVVALAGAGALGAYDDLAGDGGSKGLAGHLRALRHGRVTTGAAKVVGLAVTGVAAAVLVDSSARRQGSAVALDALVGGAVVAGAANLVNLLDLRPGRALKATLLAAALVPGAGRPLAAVAAGAGLAALPGDLAERSMLGDTGANAAGALLGVAVLASTPPTSARRRLLRATVLTALTALTLASERVSFTAVIESTPLLRAVDGLGRRSAAPR